jgi:hypothetical protein
VPRLGIVLAAQADQVPMESVAENLRAVHPKRLRPALNLGRLVIRHAKAEHRHTALAETQLAGTVTPQKLQLAVPES